jgi:hypothetical protein
VGGLNPVAVEAMALSRGGRGRVVYMPTVDAAARVPNSPNAVAVSRNGQLLPEALDVLKMIAKHDLGLSTGHVSAEEALMVIRAAKAAGSQQDLRAAPEPRGDRDVHGADERGGPSRRAD